MMLADNTIFAPATAPGRAAVAVLRLSGPGTAAALVALAGPLPAPRRLTLRRLVHDGVLLDQALVIWMPGPASYTGEDSAELHLHGGPAVRAAVLAALTALPGLRAAEPGEFTRRAFLNDRLDLTAVEGLADLIDAETEAQRRQALRQLEGGLRQRIEAWRERLLEALSWIEATLDFSDEDGVDLQPLRDKALATAGSVAAGIEALLAEGSCGERLREGFRVVIAGAPNAGKSTLLNVLARRDVAIVSDVPGTTRDAIEVRLDLDGLPVWLVDTAGLRTTDDPVEREGVARSRRHAAEADLVLWLVAPDAAGEAAPPGCVMRVLTKVDLGASDRAAGHAVSALTGEGLGELLDALAEAAKRDVGTGDALVTRSRHRAALQQALTALQRGRSAAEDELIAEDLRSALHALGEIVGRVGVEAMLDRLFAGFCIGK